MAGSDSHHCVETVIRFRPHSPCLQDKALVAARIDTAIERELLERLKKGTVSEAQPSPG